MHSWFLALSLLLWDLEMTDTLAVLRCVCVCASSLVPMWVSWGALGWWVLLGVIRVGHVMHMYMYIVPMYMYIVHVHCCTCMLRMYMLYMYVAYVHVYIYSVHVYHVIVGVTIVPRS